MSLVGNLEDLSLGDILQIISLSQKSGVLVLESTAGAGRILFQNGLIQSACVKGGATDLQSLLVGGDVIDPAGFDACRARAQDAELLLEDALIQETDLTEESLESLMRESVESAVFEMFRWASGDFSFDVRSGTEPEDPQLILKAGSNAQYLAMEGMRLIDEGGRSEEANADDPAEAVTAPTMTDVGAELDSSEAAFQSLFGDEPLETDEAQADADATDPLADLDFETESPLEASVEAEAPAHQVAARAIERAAPSGIEPSEADVLAIQKLPVVLIEPEVSALEWLKSSISTSFAKVHVFQKADQGLSRIRQYMIRGEFPVVLISTAVEIDPLSGIHGLGDFVKRLKAQANQIRVIALREIAEEDQPKAKDPAIAVLDATIDRPSERQAREWSADENQQARSEFAQTLRDALLNAAQAGGSASPAPEPVVQDGKSEIQRLRDMTEKLQVASSRGEILPVVLEFAAEQFARAAILVAREHEIFAVAGRGIETLEVDPLGASNSVSVPAHEEGWIRTVVETGKPLQAPPQTDADRILLDRFGGLIPDAAYLGPILSGGGVVALLYGDPGESGRPLPDASSLEVVLHHAGVALDRAALERARWEAEEGSA
ncbi:MAG: DUF4388 domain-containing protein [Myxococcota bacterium]